MACASSVGFVRLLSEPPPDYTVTKTGGNQDCIQLFDSKQPYLDSSKTYPSPDNLYYFGYRQASITYLLLMNMTDISHDIAALIRPYVKQQLLRRYHSLKPLYSPLQMYRALDDFAESCGLDYLDPDGYGPSLFEYLQIEISERACMINRRLGHPNITAFLDYEGIQLSRVDRRNYEQDPETWHIKRREAGRETVCVHDENFVEEVQGNGEFAKFFCDYIARALESQYEREAEDREDQSDPEPSAKRRRVCVIDLADQ